MSVIASLTLLAAASQARLGFLTAGELANRCNESAPTSITYCYAYVTAVYDTMRAYEVWLDQREFCVPVAISQNELRRTFMAFAERRPEVRTGLAASGVAIALKETYPCPDEPKSEPVKPEAVKPGKARTQPSASTPPAPGTARNPAGR